MRSLLLLLLASLSYSAQLERLTLAGMNEVIGSYDDDAGILTIATASGMLRAPYARSRILSRGPITRQEVDEIWKKREESAKEALTRHEAIAPLAVAPLSQPAPEAPAAAAPGAPAMASGLAQVPPQLLQQWQQLPPQVQQQLQKRLQQKLPGGQLPPQLLEQLQVAPRGAAGPWAPAQR